MSELTIFIVESDAAVRDALTATLEGAGLRTVAFASALQFIDGYRSQEQGCLVVEVDLPGIDGIQLLHMLAAAGSGLPAIATSTRLASHRLRERLPPGVAYLLEKPFGEDELLALIGRALAPSDPISTTPAPPEEIGRDPDSRPAGARLAWPGQ